MKFKKYTYIFFLCIYLVLVSTIFTGSILRHHYEGGEKFINLQKTLLFLASFPSQLKNLYESNFNLNVQPKLTKHIEKDKLKFFTTVDFSELLVLPRFDHKLNKGLIEIIDLKDFKILHTYSHDLDSMNRQIDNIKEFDEYKIEGLEKRFEYWHPLLLSDGSIISHGLNGPLFKIDICSNLIWLNDDDQFHHAIEQDNHKNVLAIGRQNPYSTSINSLNKIHKKFKDDSIYIIDVDTGKILFKKSISEILIENKFFDQNFIEYSKKISDPIHLNDVEIATKNSDYWNKGDIFMSLRHQSLIIHYRPNDNKIIKIIDGPFAQQHDVDIISDNEIAIFNNNNFLNGGGEFSEILIYNFENEKFIKKFNKELIDDQFYTRSQGLYEFFPDGSLLVEEQNHGRIIIYDNYGNKKMEYINKDENGDIGFISWSRLISDKTLINNFKESLSRSGCIK